MITRQRIAVAAAVISNNRGEFLLAQRPPGKPYPGYWEFPGGKIESGEAPPQASYEACRSCPARPRPARLDLSRDDFRLRGSLLLGAAYLVLHQHSMGCG